MNNIQSNAFIAFSKAANGADQAARFQAAYAQVKKLKDFVAISNRFKAAA